MTDSAGLLQPIKDANTRYQIDRTNAHVSPHSHLIMSPAESSDLNNVIHIIIISDWIFER